ncbi:MAG: homoserine kinase, partial [Bacteroidota bacterium]
MESIRVFAPASVANVSCGYDIFGFAIHEKGDEITLKKRADHKLHIESIEGADLPTRPDKNVATVAIASLLNHLGSNQGFDVHIKKIIPPSSGLGSSACSASGAVFAASELMQTGLSKHELVPYAMDGEIVASQKAHADNIAPAMLGGFTVVRSCEPEVDIFQIDYPEDLHALIIFPQIEIKTSEAKQILGNTVDLGKAREQWGNVAGLVTGLMRKDWDLIQRSMVDVVAEPLRKKLIPHYDLVQEIVLASGAVG